MLRELHVKNLAVLASASVRFGPGLNVLTGETGAGKSIVVDSLTLLAGGRASHELIRTGAERLTVSGVFALSPGGWQELLESAGLESEEGPEQGELLVRREISRGGRNRVFINDQPTTLRLLSELAPFLLRIHGQREELGLIAPDLQRHWLDRSGGAAATPLLNKVRRAFDAYEDLASRLRDLTGNQRLRWERIDLLRFQTSEIDAADLQAGEDQDLRREREQLRHGEAIGQALGSSLDLLADEEGAAAARLARSAAQLRKILPWEPAVDGWLQELEEVRIRTEELAGNLRHRLDELDTSPGRLDAVEERLAVVERLCRKYGGSVDEILSLRETLQEELAGLESDSESSDALRAKAQKALEDYRREASALSRARHTWGESLVQRMAQELAELGLDKSRLEVALEPRPWRDSPLEEAGQGIEFGPMGTDQVTFLFSPNPGEATQPLARVASGGELSRLSLALQLAAGGERASAQPTLVFDEVDTGVGGSQAASLGRKLQRLAASGQILAVTHLPQVASFGDGHFKVAKVVRSGRTHTQVSLLDGEQRMEETARMLAGKKVTEISRTHAEELLRTSARKGASKRRRKAMS
ncbi:MAG: DNA repair protein RecN [Deltaproteobacteria bacterium]|nr:DNA repair protein RecN [Deltaproteobacteria bacterium]